MQFTAHAVEAYLEPFQASKTELFLKKINDFQLLTSLPKSSTSYVLQDSEYASFQLNINTNKLYMAKANHSRRLRKANYLWTLETTLSTESNELSAELALPPHPASSLIKDLVLFHYNNLIQVFPLSSVRNSDKFSFDTLTNLQQSFVSMFYRKRAVKNKV